MKQLYSLLRLDFFEHCHAFVLAYTSFSLLLSDFFENCLVNVCTLHFIYNHTNFDLICIEISLIPISILHPTIIICSLDIGVIIDSWQICQEKIGAMTIDFGFIEVFISN